MKIKLGWGWVRGTEASLFKMHLQGYKEWGNGTSQILRIKKKEEKVMRRRKTQEEEWRQ